MEEEKRVQWYQNALYLLPEHLQRAARNCSKTHQAEAEELRLRMGQPLSLLGTKGEISLSEEPICAQDLQTVLDRATEFSAYHSADSIRRGYITVRGGCRIGLCGTAVQRGGEIATLQDLSSLAIRIAKEIRGSAQTLYPLLWQEGWFESTLLIAPPGGGKTTLLRDLIRCLSNGDGNHPALRVSVVDERGEIAAVHSGCAQFDVGAHTDILAGTAKAEGILMLLRAMNPQLIAVDEITDPEDIRSMGLAANCGVSFLATVHGQNLQEIRRRRICRELLDTELFHQFVILKRSGGKHIWQVERC